jgi:pimeloyl-ACP methyl ester carboxylesterase
MERFASYDGVQIAYLRRGEGPPILLHHGFGADHHANWVAPGVVEALVAAGRDVVALDARGHGVSGKPHEPEAYADNAMARDVKALLDHLDFESVDIVGYSMGSIVSSIVVPSEPRARSLVLGGVGGHLVKGRVPIDRKAVAGALLADDPNAVDNPVARGFRQFVDSTGADRLALAAMQQAHDVERIPDLATITVPTLVLVGEGDVLVGRPEKLAAAIPGARSCIVPGDHLTAPFSPEFTAALLDFLSS